MPLTKSERNRRYREKHRDEQIARMKRWREANRERVNAYRRAYVKDRPESKTKVLERKRKYRQGLTYKRYLQRKKDQYKANPERFKPKPKPKYEFSCKACGCLYLATRELAGCRNKECVADRVKAANPYVPRTPTIIKECAACLRYFLGLKNRVTCSEACKAQHKKNTDLACQIRRIFRQSGCDAEPYSRMQIFKRDKWRCGICGEKVDRKLRHPHMQSASIDHIVPLARGGADAEWNVQCAHLGCNSNKGDSIVSLW